MWTLGVEDPPFTLLFRSQLTSNPHFSNINNSKSLERKKNKQKKKSSRQPAGINIVPFASPAAAAFHQQHRPIKHRHNHQTENQRIVHWFLYRLWSDRNFLFVFKSIRHRYIEHVLFAVLLGFSAADSSNWLCSVSHTFAIYRYYTK